VPTVHACRLPVLMAVSLLVGCSGERTQSALHPAGPAAAEIAWLWWVMLAAFTAVFVLVVVLLLIAVFRKARDEQAAPPLGRTRFVVAGGVVLPVVVVVPLLFLSLETSMALRTPREGRTVRVVGHQWWWEVRYPQEGIVTANEVHIPTGERVRLELASADVIHSFWVPQLGGKRDLIPGIENVFWVQADEPGVYRGQCAEYCGTQHAKMAFLVVALPPDEYQAWVSDRQRPRPAPQTPQQERGLQVFLEAGCANCHAVRGTPAAGQTGPDLTHIGGRRTLGAATIPNTHGNLAGWVSDPRPLKPGLKMPAARLAPDDLLALVAYLESLK
jgi:cytochrome c oxidase subunit II